MQGISAKLDWNRMLGFDQIADERESFGRSAKIDAKVGLKPGPPIETNIGAKIGGKIGLKPGPDTITSARIGAKVGIKPGPTPIEF